MKLTRDRLKQIIKEELQEMEGPMTLPQSVGDPGTQPAIGAASEEDRARKVKDLIGSFSDLLQQDQFLDFKEKYANLLKDPDVQKEIINMVNTFLN